MGNVKSGNIRTFQVFSPSSGATHLLYHTAAIKSNVFPVRTVGERMAAQGCSEGLLLTLFAEIFIINDTLGGINARKRRRSMDIKKKIEELVEKITSDKQLMAKFQKDPIGTVEKLIGMDLPNDQIEKLVDGIKAKIKLDDLGDALGALGGLFGRK